MSARRDGVCEPPPLRSRTRNVLLAIADFHPNTLFPCFNLAREQGRKGSREEPCCSGSRFASHPERTESLLQGYPKLSPMYHSARFKGRRAPVENALECKRRGLGGIPAVRGRPAPL